MTKTEPIAVTRALPSEPLSNPRPPPTTPMRHVAKVKLHFKASSIMASRRDALQLSVDSFYDYLVTLGYEPPLEVPPIGTDSQSAESPCFSRDIGGHPDRPYQGEIYISQGEIDNPETIQCAYAYYTFITMLRTFDYDLSKVKPMMTLKEAIDLNPSLADPDRLFRFVSASYFADYYVSSFSSKRVFRKDRNPENALWELRTIIGKQFVDTALFYEFVNWTSRTPLDTDHLDGLFMARFVRGAEKEDNNSEHMPVVKKVLGDYGY